MYISKRCGMFMGIVAAFLVTASCATVPENRISPSEVAGRAVTGPTNPLTSDINQGIAVAAMSSSSGSLDYRIGSEDLLDITLFNIPEADGRVTPRTVTVRVSQEGRVTLPLIGDVPVKGLTVSGLEQELRKRYDTYLYNPQVGVLIREFRQRVSVIGAINKPGVVELTSPKTVIEILALAGGVTDRAGSQVHIYRDGAEGRESHVIDLTVLADSTGLINATNAPMINMPVQPGDLINVPVAGMFFVDGAVRRPGSYPLGRQYSLTQALATAGGVDVELNSNDITIFRRQGPGKVDSIALDLSDVMAGTARDPQILPDDVIVVPTSTAKYVVRRFIGTLVGGLSIGSFIPR